MFEEGNNIFSEYEDFFEYEKDNFKRICNKLLSEIYIVEDIYNKDTKSFIINNDYIFLKRHFTLFEYYFEMSGWKLLSNNLGVIYIKNEAGANKKRLDKLTTFMLLALRLIFEEKKREASLSENIFIKIRDIFDVIIKEFSIYMKLPSKTEIINSLKGMEKYNIIYMIDRNDDYMENTLIIFQSIVAAVPNDKITMFRNMVYNGRNNINEETIENDVN